MSAKVASINQPSPILLSLALILATLLQTFALNNLVEMTLHETKLGDGVEAHKAINVTCHFNKTIPDVVAIGLDRKVPKGNGLLQEKILEAKGEVEDGEMRMVKRYGPGGPLYQFNGSFQDRWFNFVLANFSEADYGEYVCYVIYRRHPNHPWVSATENRILNSATFEHDEIKVVAQKEYGELQRQTDMNHWIFENVQLGVGVLVCTLALAGLAAMIDRDRRENIRNQQAAAAQAEAAAAAAAAASSAPEESLGSAASGHSAESLAPTAALPAVLAAGTVGLAEADLAAASSDVSRMPSPEPSPLESQSAPAVLETVPSVALEMVPLTLEERPPTPTGGQSESLL